MNPPSFYTDELVNKINSRAANMLSEEKTSILLGELNFLEEMLNSIIGDLGKNYYDLKPMRLAWCLTKGANFGAFCYTSKKGRDSEKFDFIGINLGTISILYDNFTHILSSPHSFVEFGDCTKENNEPTSFWLSKVANNDAPFTLPNCPIRAGYANLLTTIALRFLVIHEVTHLYNGHLDWSQLNSGCNNSFLDDFSDTIVPEKDLIRHFFEIDADDCALQMSICHYTHCLNTYSSHRMAMKETDRAVTDLAFGSIEKTIITVLYSLYVLFRSTDPAPWNEGKIGTSSHPRELVRARYVFNRFLQVITWYSEIPENSDALIDLMLIVVREAERDISRMVGREMDITSFRDLLFSDYANEHIREIGVLQRKLVPALKPYLRGTRFPKPNWA